MRVEETGDDGAPAEVDRARVTGDRAQRPDARNAAVPNRQRRADLSAAVHELAVDENKIARPDGLCRCLDRLCPDAAAGNGHSPRGGALEQFSSRQHLHVQGAV